MRTNERKRASAELSAHKQMRTSPMSALSHRVRQPQQVRRSVNCGVVVVVSYLVDESAKEEKGGETYYSYSTFPTEEKSDSPSFFRL